MLATAAVASLIVVAAIACKARANDAPPAPRDDAAAAPAGIELVVDGAVVGVFALGPGTKPVPLRELMPADTPARSTWEIVEVRGAGRTLTVPLARYPLHRVMGAGPAPPRMRGLVHQSSGRCAA